MTRILWLTHLKSNATAKEKLKTFLEDKNLGSKVSLLFHFIVALAHYGRKFDWLSDFLSKSIVGGETEWKMS